MHAHAPGVRFEHAVMLVQVCAFRFVCQSFQVLHNAPVIMLLSLLLNRRDRGVEVSRETTPKAISGNTGGTASSHAWQTSSVFPDDDDVELHVLRCRVDTLGTNWPVPKHGSVLLYVHRNRRLIRDRRPGRPPRLSHSSWVQCCFTSTKTVGLLGTGAQDGHSSFTHLLNSKRFPRVLRDI